MRRKMKLILILITTMTMLQVGCGKEKTLILTDDVSKRDPIVMKEKLQVKEQVINLKIDKENSFQPVGWSNDKMLGMIVDRRELDVVTDDKMGVLYKLDNGGNFQETNMKAMKNVYWGDKGIASSGFLGDLYYYDFKDEKTFTEKLISTKDLFEELAIDSVRVSSNRIVDLVKGNEKYMLGIINMPTGAAIKLFDINNKKLYTSDKLDNVIICNMVYIKGLNEFVAIDNTGQTYKANIIDNKIKIDRFVKIDLGHNNGIEIGDASLLDDNAILIKNIGNIDLKGKVTNVATLMMTYNFNNNKVEKLIKKQSNDGVRIDQYYNKQNLAVISMRSEKNNQQIESVYLAKVNNAGVDYIHKLNNDMIDGEKCFQVTSIINESGDRLFLERWLKKGEFYEGYRKVIHFCNIK